MVIFKLRIIDDPAYKDKATVHFFVGEKGHQYQYSGTLFLEKYEMDALAVMLEKGGEITQEMARVEFIND